MTEPESVAACIVALDEIGALHKPRLVKTAPNWAGLTFDTLQCRICRSATGSPESWPCATMRAIDAVLPLAEWSDHYRSGCDHGMSAHNKNGCVDCACKTPGFSIPNRAEVNP